MIPGGRDESPALALARSALARAADAERKAEEAHKRLDELLRPSSLPPMRGRAPSVDEIAQAVRIPSERVTRLVQTGIERSHMKNSKISTWIGVGIAILGAAIPVLAGHADALHISAGSVATVGVFVAALSKALGERS